MTETIYRRPLPHDAIAFSSPEGRRLFGEALASGGLDGYFPLAEQFHTQADPMFCGLGSLVVALNALAIDPGRLWKGPWRWFAEDLLDCCVPLEEVRRRGLDLDELACLARCNGAEVELTRGSLDELRAALAAAARGGAVLIAAYDRGSLGQTGTGHFSPVGGYHPARDLALVLDVARFKYPPHWVAVEQLWRAMQPVDPASGRPRGWMLLRPRRAGVALAFTIHCDATDVRAFAASFARAVRDAGTSTIDQLARELDGLATHLTLREPTSDAHRTALTELRAALRAQPVFERVRGIVGDVHAEAVAMLMLAVGTAARSTAGELAALVADAARDPTLGPELDFLRAQLEALERVAD
jgi:glutathione gamma-glutamylcysteinyltransferase